MREPIRELPPRRIVRPSLRLVLGLAVLVFSGTFALLLPAASTRPLDFSEALFTAISALTVTGLTVIAPGTDLTLFGQIVLLLLIQIGGVGYMVLAVTAFRLIGRHVTLADRLALRDALGLISLRGVLDLTGHVLRAVLAIELVGAVLLFINWREMMPPGEAVFYSIFHSVSAFCNAGFDLFAAMPERFDGLPRDTGTLSIMAGLIFLGGLGIPVLFDFVMWGRRREFSLHSRITVPLVLTLVLGGAAAFYVSEGLFSGVLVGEPPHRAAVMSIFQSVSARTAGFVGVADFDNLEPASELVIGSLMFIGCAPASMGGGITTGTLATLVLALWAYGRGRETPVFKGRAIPGEMVRKAAAVLTVSILLIVASTWLLALTHPVDLDIIGFEVVSAFATCGLTMGLTDELNWFGRSVIVFMMFWGRLGALTVLVALAGRTDKRLVRYPEERILIG
jgi:trk system potassium uptake protein